MEPPYIIGAGRGFFGFSVGHFGRLGLVGTQFCLPKAVVGLCGLISLRCGGDQVREPMGNY